MCLQSIEEYIYFLQGKGFQFQEDAIGFIYFGKHYTNATDDLINTAIEVTLKVQKRFDGSYYISLLEMLTTNKIQNRQDAIEFIKQKQIPTI
jgi:hypothetical protein